MKTAPKNLRLFVVLLFIIVVFFFVPGLRIGAEDALEKIIFPLQAKIASVFSEKKPLGDDEKGVDLDNLETIKNSIIKKEIEALQSQFRISSPNQRNLLPVNIIGMKGYIPAVSLPNEFIIDKGESSGIKNDFVVVYKDSLVGVVEKTTRTRSLVRLFTKDGLSFTATTTKGVDGIISIEDGEIVFKNILINDKIEKGDIVVTKGSQQVFGEGIPPNIIVGKISAVDKKPSALFQSAKVKSMIELKSLSTVFVYIPGE